MYGNLSDRCPASEAEIDNDLNSNWLGDNEYSQIIEAAADQIERSGGEMVAASVVFIEDLGCTPIDGDDSDSLAHLLAELSLTALMHPEEALISLRKMARHIAEQRAIYLADKYGYRSVDDVPEMTQTDPDDVLRFMHMRLSVEGY